MGNSLTVEASPLFDAIADGDVDAAIRALEARPGLSHKRAGNKGRTVYHACASKGQVAVLRRLCEHIWKTVPDEFGKVHDGLPPEGRSHPTIFRAINSYDHMGLTPLILACKKGHAQVVEYLLTQGADPWIGDRLMGRSPLHFAARGNHPDCIDAILTSAYVDQVGKVRTREHKLVDYPSNAGYTPLHYTATIRAADAAAVLFRHGANPNSKSWDLGFDFIQLERGCTPLHAAARYQNLDMAMLLLKYWFDNLKDMDVTDPRVVENFHRVKPYQMPGVKLNKALYRVLDPDTPIKEISDPFDETAKPIIVTPSKAAPLRQTKSARGSGLIPRGYENGAVQHGSEWSSSDKVPPGWEDLLPSDAGAVSKGCGNAPDFITVYRCAEFVPDEDAVPPPGSSPDGIEGRTVTLTRAQSTGNRITPLTSASAGLMRTQSSAPSVAVPPAPQLKKAASLQASASAHQAHDGPYSAGPRGGRGSPPGGLGLGPGGDSSLVRDGSSDRSESSGSAGCAISPRLQPIVLADCGLAGAGVYTGTRRGRSSASDAAAAAVDTAIRSPTGSRTACGMGSVKPSSPPDKLSGRSLVKTLSKRISALSGGSTTASNYDAGSQFGSSGSIPAPAPASRELGQQSRGSSPPMETRGQLPPPVMNAWGIGHSSSPDTTTGRGSGHAAATAAKQRSSKDSADEAAPAVVDFTRDSHAQDAQPVEVTMYPHYLDNLHQLKKGDTCNTLVAEGEGLRSLPRQQSQNRRSGESERGRGHPGGTGAPVPTAGSGGKQQQTSSTVSSSRKGIMPTNDLSEDESRVKTRGRAGTLSPQASRRLS